METTSAGSGAEPDSSSPALRRLVAAVRDEVARERDPAAVAEAVADHVARALSDPDLLTDRQMEPDPDGYRQHVLHVEEDGSFSVVSLVWLPGQATPVHDHVAWCVPGVYRGREEETRYRLAGAEREEASRGARPEADTHLVETGTAINRTGDVVALTPPGDLHRVRNPGPDPAVSLHVYGADIERLGSSIRRCYELPVRAGAGADGG